MKKKELAVLGGLATVMGAITAASNKKQWEEAHIAAVVLGGVVTILGALS